MKINLNILCGFLVLLFCSCSHYKVEDGKVYYIIRNEAVGKELKPINADAETFEILDYERYAKDKKFVFYNGVELVGADAKTFVALDKFYGKDKNIAWYAEDPIKGSESESFQIINAYYSRDANDVYWIIHPLNVVNPDQFRFVYGKGKQQSWTTDGQYYYFMNHRVPSEDYKNVVIYRNSGGIAKGDKWVYFQGHKMNINNSGEQIIDTIDVATFKVTGYLECRDKFGCINPIRGREECEEELPYSKEAKDL